MAEIAESLETPSRAAGRIADFLARLAELLRQARVLLPLQLLALWPVWSWYAARLGDGSDEPLGPLALVPALLVLWARRGEWRSQARPGLVLAAAALTLAGALATDAPPLIRALLGVAALGLALAAFLPRTRDAAAPAVLLALSLPLVASLQFYAGYPLRRLAAEGASLLLRGGGLPVLAEGAGLRWGERLMLVDAPCSGVHMLWVGLVAAAAASALARASPGRLMLNLGLAAALVLLGNVIRNALLFFKETGLVLLPGWTHEAVGVVLFVLVLAPVARVSLRPGADRPESGTEGGNGAAPGRLREAPPDQAVPGRGPTGPGALRPAIRRADLGLVLAGAALALAGAAGALPAGPAAPAASNPDPPWPTADLGRDLARVPLTPAETRWLRGFPGAAARFTDGGREWLVRHVERPTRLLHPAADCFRGLGYKAGTPAIREIAGQRWSCFTARRDGSGRDVCERIHDAAGGAWTDVSSWYWDAVLGRSRGPWWAVTTAGPEG
jgi:exosortase/archaeosortase family protein